MELYTQTRIWGYKKPLWVKNRKIMTDKQSKAKCKRKTHKNQEREGRKSNIISYLKNTIQNMQDRIDWKDLFEKGYWVNAGNPSGG